MLWSLILALLLLVLLFARFRSQLSGTTPYNMDRANIPGEFEKHLTRYQDFAKLIITLAGTAAGLIINVLIGLDVSHNSYRDRFVAGAPAAIVFFGFSVGAMVFFIILLNLFYEEYTHSEKKDTYTAPKYALVQALGALGSLCFVIGSFMVAIRIFLIS